MKNKVLIILIVFIFLVKKLLKKEINSYDLLPENSKVVISVNLGKFKNSIDNNSYLNSLVESNLTIKNLISQISMINDDKEIVIGLYEFKDILVMILLA